MIRTPKYGFYALEPDELDFNLPVVKITADVNGDACDKLDELLDALIRMRFAHIREQ